MRIWAKNTGCSTAQRVYRSWHRHGITDDVLPDPYQYGRFGPYFRLTAGFDCHYRPEGLAGSEHTLACKRGRAGVRLLHRQDGPI